MSWYQVAQIMREAAASTVDDGVPLSWYAGMGGFVLLVVILIILKRSKK